MGFLRTKDVFYVPGEHDIYDGGAQYRERFEKNTIGTGWYSFDQKGVHFIGLVNVANIQEGGLGTLGQEQLDWLEKDVKALSPSTAIVLFAHIPLWAVYPKWGWGTDDAERALSFLKGFGSVTVLNGHIQQVMQKVEGNTTFHTARGTAFPLPTPGSAPKPLPLVGCRGFRRCPYQRLTERDLVFEVSDCDILWHLKVCKCPLLLESVILLQCVPTK